MTSEIGMSTDFPGSAGFRQQLGECMKPPAEASSLPAACYHDTSVLDAEQHLIFRKHWIGLGRADRFSQAGQYETIDIAGVPVILIMDREHQLHAFNNACRHRGARLLEGEGTTRAIRCPFHCWNYSVDGRLVAASHMETTEDFKLSEMGLIEFALRIHAGFIFVCFAAEPPDFANFIGDFDAVHAPWPLAELLSTRRICMQANCNWKLFLDVFNEYYHLPYVHPDSINSIYQAPDAGDETRGCYASQFGETEGTGALLESNQRNALPSIPDLQGRAARGTRYTWLFPNMTFAIGTDALWIYEAYPLSTDRCLVYQTQCFPQASVQLPDFEQRVQHYYDRLDAAVAEDLQALENQQRGMNSPFTQAGRFAVGLEPNVARFAAWYAGQFLASSGGG